MYSVGMNKTLEDILHERRHMKTGTLVKSCPTCWMLYLNLVKQSLQDPFITQKMGIKTILDEEVA